MRCIEDTGWAAEIRDPKVWWLKQERNRLFLLDQSWWLVQDALTVYGVNTLPLLPPRWPEPRPLTTLTSRGGRVPAEPHSGLFFWWWKGAWISWSNDSFSHKHLLCSSKVTARLWIWRLWVYGLTGALTWFVFQTLDSKEREASFKLACGTSSTQIPHLSNVDNSVCLSELWRLHSTSNLRTPGLLPVVW